VEKENILVIILQQLYSLGYSKKPVAPLAKKLNELSDGNKTKLDKFSAMCNEQAIPFSYDQDASSAALTSRENNLDSFYRSFLSSKKFLHKTKLQLLVLLLSQDEVSKDDSFGVPITCK
jgi:hypothetical protein